MIYREVLRRLKDPTVQALPRGQRVLYRVLLEKARKQHDGTWVAHFGDAQLMRRMGYGRTSVVELRRQLEDAGLVATVDGSGQAPTRYEILEVARVSA